MWYDAGLFNFLIEKWQRKIKGNYYVTIYLKK